MVSPAVIDWAAVLTALTTTTLVSGAVVAVAAFLGRSIFQWMTGRDLQAHKEQLAQEREKALERMRDEARRALAEQSAQAERSLEALKTRLGQAAKREDHIHDELRRWANPILGAVKDLAGRLRNILEDGAFVGLAPDTSLDRGWSLSHPYFLHSTVYLFAQYFCWTRLLREELSFHLFESDEEKDAFFETQLEAARCLSSWPLPTGAPGRAQDAQVFLLQQRQMGEALIVDGAAGPACMRYADFEARWEADDTFRKPFEPLCAFLVQVSPETEARWWRLERMEEKLRRVQDACRRILDLPSGEGDAP